MGNGIIKNIKYILNCLLEMVYDTDEQCVVCGVEDVKTLCNNCFKTLTKQPLKVCIERDNYKIEGYSVSYYSKTIKELIIRLKYKSDYSSGIAISSLMEEVIKKYDIDFDFITFVPSSKRVLKKRGYNQAEYIASLLSKKCGKSYRACIKKSLETYDQIGLGKYDRWINMEDSFSFMGNFEVKGAKILLIDDVVTTGATAFNCFKILKDEGAETVTLLTAAKSTI